MMLLRSTLSLALSLGLLGNAATAQPPVERQAAQQSDPVKRIFEEWLTAFNSGDPATIKAFYGKYLGDDNPMFALENAQDTCGFDLERTEARSATTMTALLRQRCLPGLQRAKLELAADGVKLKSLDFSPLPLSGDGSIKAMAAIADRLAARNDFAGSIIIARHGNRILARNWGFADPAKRTPMTLDTPMFLASAGKMFTAVATLQLVDAGKIDLDAPMGRYLTDYPNKDMAKVTVRQLLTHRGGTGDIGILGRDDGANRALTRTINDIVRLNGNRGPDFPPGSKADYSNYGFILLGAIIERVTGGSYYDYIAEHVFKPAGMTNSGFPDHDHLQGVAVGYTHFYGAELKLVANMDVLPWRGASAGGGVSTANDMLRFLDAMKDGKLLSPTMFKLATTAGATTWYGMGFVINSEQQSWGHGGNSYGMDVAVHYSGNMDTSFVCLATRDMVCNRLIWAWNLRTVDPAQ
ncbi:MAG: serine hydrolase domain-containing protein [Sphingobium sp.]